MSHKIIDDNGDEIEVFTAEELETQKTVAVEEAKNAALTEVEQAKADLAKAQEDLKKFEDKDLNFANLRTQKEAAERKVADLSREIDEKIGAVKKEILDGVTLDHKNETIKNLAGDDKELKEKIEFHYNRISDPATTKEEVTKKLADAYLLATKKEEDDALNTAVIASGGASRVNFPSGGNKFTPEEKELARKMAQAGGITLEDKDLQ